MKPFLKELDLPPDVAGLARRFRRAPGLAVLASGGVALREEDRASSFVLAFPNAASDAVLPPAEPPSPVLGWAGRASAPRWVGVLPYEAGRGLERFGRARDARPSARIAGPRWQRYAAALRIDHRSGRVVLEADDEASAAPLLHGLAASVPEPEPFALTAEPPEPRALHAARIERALALIARGDVYEINLARRLAYRVGGSRLELFLALAEKSPAPYGFFFDASDFTVCGASPELGLAVCGELLRTGPIKGTRPRGPDAATDAALARELDLSEKERAELVMAIDLHRNDLGRVAAVGSVRVAGPPRLLAGRAVWSRAAEVTARLGQGKTALDAVVASLPCGSVTGAPKVRAMEIIAELEAHRRGLYTGLYGAVGRDGSVTLAVAIRTLEVAPDGFAEYGTGGGIVDGSVVALEVEETAWKAAAPDALARAGPAGNLPESPHVI